MSEAPFHLHLISDSTGETVSTVARATMAQFPVGDAAEHSWALVRSPEQIEKVLQSVRSHPGVVLYTLVKPELRQVLEAGCRELNVPCVDVLAGVMDVLSQTLGTEVGHSPGRQHALDSEYYARIEAMQFVLAHDDGHAIAGLDKADVVLVGVSRTSKTPTCIYLANRGIKAANVPYVSPPTFPDEQLAASSALVVALTTSADRLVQIRRNRLIALNDNRSSDYTDLDTVRREIADARRIFTRHGWPVIDVSRRSIEETAAAILQLYRETAEET
jgi:[pyruvate, water dikinase]-phosphate phosphotransferase / [pyruvate, water dikinase] kinase